jgi:hypothetical protein
MNDDTTVFDLPVRPSWFQNQTTHHIYIPAELARALGARDDGGSIRVAVYVGETNIANGMLQGTTWFLTEVDDVFRALAITSFDADKVTVQAQGRQRDGQLVLHMWRREAGAQSDHPVVASRQSQPNAPAGPETQVASDWLDDDCSHEAAAEGALRQISVNVYERSAPLRAACIEHYGVACTACDFRFEDTYGRIGAGFTHVHHLVPLSEVAANHHVDPIADLRPLCANCHAIVHRREPQLTLKELIEAISAARAAS